MARYLNMDSATRQGVAPWLPLVVILGSLCGACAVAQDSDTGTVAGYLLDAEAALDARDYKRAAAQYRKAAELSENPDTARQATRIAYAYGFNEDAAAAAARWRELEPESEEAMLYLAQSELRRGRLRASEKVFRELLESGEETPDRRLASLIPILSQEDPEDATELAKRLARPYRDSAYAHYAVGVLALQAGDAEEAGERARRAIELDGDWLKPRLLYSRSLLLSGDEQGAIDYAARMVGDDPSPDPEARLELAIMYLSVGRDDDALSQVNQVLLEQPARADALRLMAIINFRLENFDAAQADFEDLLRTGEYTMDAVYYLARIADRREETDRAIALYSEVTQGDNAVVSQRRAAGLLAESGDEEAALEHLADFGEAHPAHAVDMVEARAQLLATLDRHEEALEAYDRAIEYRPDDEGMLLGRAELLIRMDRLDDAIRQYRAAVRRFPDSASSLNALGYTLADRTDRYDEAYRLIRKALDIEPHSPAIIDSYGWVLYRLGRYEPALEELERAWSMFRDPEIAAHIVEVLWKLDRNEEARALLEEASAEFPDSDLLEDIRRRAFPAD